jgi:hypothetical protein
MPWKQETGDAELKKYWRMVKRTYSQLDVYKYGDILVVFGGT